MNGLKHIHGNSCIPVVATGSLLFNISSENHSTMIPHYSRRPACHDAAELFHFTHAFRNRNGNPNQNEALQQWINCTSRIFCTINKEKEECHTNVENENLFS